MRWLIMVAMLLSFVSCKEDAKIIEDNPKFPIPKASNGIIFHKGSLWMTDLVGQAVYKVSPENGGILDYFSYAHLGAGIDDIEVLNDGTMVWTSPLKNFAGKTTPDGKSTILLRQINSINPVTISKDERYAYFCSSTGNPVTLYRVDLQTDEVVALNEEMIAVNGYDMDDDGFIYAPNPIDPITGRGKLVKINSETGQFSTLEVDFINEPLKRDFEFPTGVVIGMNNRIYVLESLNPKVYVVDKRTLEATLLHKLPLAFSDNIAVDDEENVYVTSFVDNKIAKIFSNGDVKVLQVK